jgi:hypothetical protein
LLPAILANFYGMSDEDRALGKKGDALMTKIAWSPRWSEAEVQQAIAEIKKEPGLWDELERIERTQRDFGETKAGNREFSILVNLHPECVLNEIGQLHGVIRAYHRRQLGLS